jgi:hypothetical protein
MRRVGRDDVRDSPEHPDQALRNVKMKVARESRKSTPKAKAKVESQSQVEVKTL